ncbi:MAG: hypothetical protein KUG76_08285 [Gammaproteobacteria bacterium]|nr:hypothetical protein [Gammaproteobacteria bacterium]
MNHIRNLGLKYKQHFYSAQVDKPSGFQITLYLLGLFLLCAVGFEFTTPRKAALVFIVLSLFFSVFPLIFPEEKTGA